MKRATKEIIRLIFLLPLSKVMGVHDSLNMILPPGGQECFFEEFVKDANPREVEIFIPQNGNVDIVLKVYGPMTLVEVQQVVTHMSWMRSWLHYARAAHANQSRMGICQLIH